MRFQEYWSEIRRYIIAMPPEVFERMWRFYLAGFQASFELDRLDVLQILVSRGTPEKPVVGIFPWD